MIAGIFWEGSGLGDQLFRYITVRTLAEEKGFDFAMLNWGNFKGDSFIDIQPKVAWAPQNSLYWNEKDVRQHQDFPNESLDIRSYDPEINFVEDNTIIDGSFEDSKYWGHNLTNISKWLAVEPLFGADVLSVIGFRGGEYANVPELFLPKEYYQKGVDILRNLKPDIEFGVHTDDPTLAYRFFFDAGLQAHIFQNEQISHSKHTNMGFNWRSARYAKYAIIPNSAFFILPRLLKHFEDPTAVTIAPRYWAGHNQKIWKRPATYYKPFTYIHASNSFKL